MGKGWLSFMSSCRSPCLFVAHLVYLPPCQSFLIWLAGARAILLSWTMAAKPYEDWYVHQFILLFIRFYMNSVELP